MDRTKRATSRGRCEHDAFPVEVLTVGGGRKKIAHCLGCGRSGPVRQGSTEALIGLRGLRDATHVTFLDPSPAARKLGEP